MNSWTATTAFFAANPLLVQLDAGLYDLKLFTNEEKLLFLLALCLQQPAAGRSDVPGD